jgi:TatD DNase family protein
MIDTHAHIDTAAFDDDRSEMLKRAYYEGIESIIIPAIEPNTYSKLFDTLSLSHNLYCAIGVHPQNANQLNEYTISQIEEFVSEYKVVAIGEIGLDYYYDYTSPEIQKDALIKQINIAKKFDLPVIIHNRDAGSDLMKILSEYGDGVINGVLHCFSGNKKMLEEALYCGYYISFTGNITFKNSTSVEMLSETPLDRLLLETDSPWMTPVPHRGKRNEPSYLKYIVEKIAQIKSVSINEVIKMTSQNAKKLFKLLLFLFFVFSYIPGYSQDKKVSAKPKTSGESFSDMKLLGFGPIIGSNTMIITYFEKEGDRDVSFEGIVNYGGTILYKLFDYCIMDLSITHSVNKKVIEPDPEHLEPNYYTFIDLSTHWTPNPQNRINIFGTAGGTLFFNSINGKNDVTFGINTGLGFFANIEITGLGLFSLTAEWRINFQLGKVDAILLDHIDPITDEPIYRVVPSSTFYSTPRFGIIWFPEF